MLKCKESYFLMNLSEQWMNCKYLSTTRKKFCVTFSTTWKCNKTKTPFKGVDITTILTSIRFQWYSLLILSRHYAKVRNYKLNYLFIIENLG